VSRSADRRGRGAAACGGVPVPDSPQGQRLIREARRRYDTPANRAKLRQVLAELRGGKQRR
jgi:hypothetical protein